MKFVKALCVIIFSITTVVPHNVGVCIMATGNYLAYAERLIRSMRQYFCTGHAVRYFLFSDGKAQLADDVVCVFQKRLGWPHDTLKRFHVYEGQKELLSQMDYIFAIDADMLLVAPVGDEILSELVVVQHPGYIGRRGTYETRPRSAAYVARDEGEQYYAGGFYGGTAEAFFSFVRAACELVDRDEQRGIIAVWHDESYLNRLMIDKKPPLVLSPSYCYPEGWQLPYQQKIIALNKRHNEMRRGS